VLGRRAKLDPVEASVSSVERQQLVVRPALDDRTLMQHEDDVRVTDRRQTVGDRDRRAAVEQPRNAFEDQVLRFRIERGRRFVEQKNGRVADQRSGDGDPLALSS